MHTHTHIVIVGGGFSGTMTAIQLVRSNQPNPIRISLINQSPDIGRGLAYRFDDENLMLNVPAGNMSALADDHDHFVNYCRTIDPSLSHTSFVSRRLYGCYMQDLWAQALTAHRDTIETIQDEAKTLRRAPRDLGWEVQLASGNRLNATHVVIATGHQAPKFPSSQNPEVEPYIIDPWNIPAMRRLSSNQAVMILGTGPTAVDALFCLTQLHRQQPVYLISRHGLLPKPHRPAPSPPKPPLYPEYLRSVPLTVRAQMRAVRQHINSLIKQGGDWRDAINALRPYTQKTWQSWDITEQQKFLRHLQSYWNAHRHRLAPTVAQRLHKLINNQQAIVISGRILSVQKHAGNICVYYRTRGSQHIEQKTTSAVINCSGPNTDIRRSTNTLLSQLLSDKLIQPDPHGLGLLVSPKLQVLGHTGKPIKGLWYIGPLLKGTLWEAVAVPELRVLAQNLAHTLRSSR